MKKKSVNICFNRKISNNNVIKNKENILFSAYLAGLFEGDGHILIDNQKNKKLIKKIIIGITFNIKDLPLCERIKEVLGVG